MKAKKHTKLYEWQLRCKSGKEACSCGDTRNLSVDHIVPVSILEPLLPGVPICYEYEENFQIMCRYCNQVKGGRLDARNPKTYSVLRKVLDIAEREAFHKAEN